MSKGLVYLLLLIALFSACSDNNQEELIENRDIERFWSAYDEIIEEKDSSIQLSILNDKFIRPASPGQTKLFEVRRYTPEEYIQNINNYPEFYRQLKLSYFNNKNRVVEQMKDALNRFKEIYPINNSKVYLGIGNFRTNGTTVDSMVLIGSEFAFTSKSTNLSEFPENYNFFRNYLNTDPVNNMDFLSVHEFVHTQQIEAIGSNLLTASLREGSAEFIAELLMHKPSKSPAVKTGLSIHEEVIKQFKTEMFNKRYTYWLGSNQSNQFNLRDLGYYVGYAISKKFYKNSKDKNKAIAKLIELDYSDDASIETFIDSIKYFDQSISELRINYEQLSPKVKSIVRNGNQFTVKFSKPMNIDTRGFDYGPLGESNVLRIQEVIGYNENATEFTFVADVQEGETQQLTVSSAFLGLNGIQLVPYVYTINE